MPHDGRVPRVSVVIPVYNSAPYLAAALDSVIAQTYTDFELVIVDDGSTDGGPRILADYAERDSRIRVITTVNRGIGAASQTLLEAARGELLAWMDNDDVMVAERVEAQVAYLDAHPELAAVGSQWMMTSATMDPLIIDAHSTDPEASFAFAFAYQSIHNPTVCVRRSALLAIGGFDADEWISHDTALYLQLALSGYRYASVPLILYSWRSNPGGVTNSRALEQTRRVDALRKAAFAKLRINEPQKAQTVAMSILESFPAGTEFDEKLRTLTGASDRSYLIDALPQDGSAEARLRQLIYRWFDAPQSASIALEQELQRQGQSLYAALLSLHDGRAEEAADAISLARPHTILSTPSPVAGVMVYLPFDGDETDLSERLSNIRACGRSVLLTVFPLSDLAPGPLRRLQLLCNEQGASLVDSEGWYRTLCQHSAAVVAYALPGHRFDPGAFAASVNAVASGKHAIACTPLVSVYPFARINGKPGVDPLPTRSRSMSTLAGQRRLSLTSFVHDVRVLEGFPLALAELGAAGAEEALQWFLTHHGGAQVIEGLHQVLVPDVRIQDNVLPHFYRHLVRSAFEGGLVLGKSCEAYPPPATTWTTVSSLDARYRRGHLLLHPANAGRIARAFGRVPLAALATQLGRDLMCGYGEQLEAALKASGHSTWVRVCSLATPWMRLAGQVWRKLRPWTNS